MVKAFATDQVWSMIGEAHSAGLAISNSVICFRTKHGHLPSIVYVSKNGWDELVSRMAVREPVNGEFWPHVEEIFYHCPWGAVRVWLSR